MNIKGFFKKNSKWIIIAFIAIILFCILGSAAYSFLVKKNLTSNDNTQEKTLIVLISMDGLGSNLINSEDTPFLNSLVENTNVFTTLETKSLIQSETLPNHVSMLTGLTQTHHGVNFNTADKSTSPLIFKTLFDYSLENDYSYYVFLTKEKLRYLLGGKEGKNIVVKEENSSDVLDDIDNMVETKEEKVFVFIHFRDIDTYGHKYGWGSEEQRDTLVILDNNLKLLVNDLQKEFKGYNRYFVFTADHGGEGMQHSSGCEACRRIPMILLSDNTPRYKFKYYNFAIYDTVCVVLKLMKVTKAEGLDCVLDTDFTNLESKSEI